MYHVSEVIKIQLPATKQHFDIRLESLDYGGSKGNSSNSSWAIDSMLIDEEMLYLEDEEADRMY